ncbi:(Zrou_YGOB_Anc_8.869) [Zygosaccharomyces parabailii]|nr:(Zrou_YGOB_Anc_8.869) [Zygosaccharomyces parabailii]CDH16908.1 uncharacterized protein ZBAI_08696 [Zygosaccharomyces bailii ISA1307]
MGNDGGTINKTHGLKLDPAKDNSQSTAGQDLREFRETSLWKCCRLTNKRLRLPVVSDSRGHLLNKESVLEWLLTPKREDFNEEQIEQFAHIKKLNDVVNLHGLQELDDGLLCEFSGEILGNTSVRFAYLNTCGDVVPKTSLTLLTEMQCPKCNIAFQKQDIITLNPSAQELEALERRIKRLDELGVHHNGKPKSTKRMKTNENHAEGKLKKVKKPCKT